MLEFYKNGKLKKFVTDDYKETFWQNGKLKEFVTEDFIKNYNKQGELKSYTRFLRNEKVTFKIIKGGKKC